VRSKAAAPSHLVNKNEPCRVPHQRLAI
jgi:hypothetical protein